jgi:hypothetical protein
VGGAIGAVHRVIHATLSLAARGRIDLGSLDIIRESP